MTVFRFPKASILAAISAMALAFGGGAMAQQEQELPGGPEEEGGPQMELQEIQQRLAQLQEEAIEQNPGLQDQRDDLENLVIQTMEEAGYDPNANIDTLESVQEQMQDESLSDEERQQMLQEAQEAQQSLQEAQQVAMQEDNVVEAQDAFQDDLMAAMRDMDPEVDDMIDRFQELQEEMQGGMGGQPAEPAPQQ